MKQVSKLVGMIAGPVAFLLVLLFFRRKGLDPAAIAVLASTIWIAIWWITEAIPIAATALLPVVLFPLTGALELQATTTVYGHRYIFLYIGGFLLAIAIEKWNLHKRIALNIIYLIGTNVSSIILGFMVATAFLSMWISNTATAVMMLPIGLAIIAQLRDNPDTLENENEIFGKALMLSIAYSASIGGMATLIGTPPNLVLASVVSKQYGVEISFLQWFAFGFPISITLLAVCWYYLTRCAFRLSHLRFPGGRAEVKRHLDELGRISFEERLVLGVFLLTAISWIGRSFVQGQLKLQLDPEMAAIPAHIRALLSIDDTIIAMIAGLTLFLIPSKVLSVPLLSWEDSKKLPWGILLLFGGGMALAEGFKTSGLATWIGGQMTLLEGISLILLVMILIAAVNFLTEITSNVATTSMLLPILAPMAIALDIHPLLLMVSATLAASCAFMLPVATPPNAVVFGSELLRIPDMVRSGFFMNLISILILTLFVYFFLGQIWGIDPTSYPEGWNRISDQ
ncbi:MAG: sodium-dependent dicarboxylate transporter 2/3/5 [Pirellulaceae bacterium]|jgi:sodium-dependent dicarboxylate transporter 2/3/5